jgi:5'-phosphate synthase pdxT subunit
MVIGVLALQGDFDAHARALGGEVPRVRRVKELDALAGLVLPGGESTTLLNLMRDEPWPEALRAFEARGGCLFGTCAGAILLAREVSRPAQPSLGLLDIAVERNGFGRQVDSFEAALDVVGLEAPVRAAFIRAPRILQVGRQVEVLARLGAEPVLVRQGNVLAATFHPEIAGEPRLHALFALMTAAQGALTGGGCGGSLSTVQ